MEMEKKNVSKGISQSIHYEWFFFFFLLTVEENNDIF